MKKSISKKLFSLFLAVMLLATSIPFTAVTASASSVADTGLNKRYVFAYFTGTNNGGQKVNIAASDDGLNYTKVSELNQTKGTGATRDPYIFDGEDGYYYIIGTDADCSIANSPWWGNSKSIILWRSADLVNWDSETIINMEEIIEKYTSVDETVNRCWAPQVYVCDADEQALNGGYKYMVYFALAAANTTGNRTIMYRCFTNNLLDQNAWQMPVLMHDQSYAQSENRGAIDGDILKISNNEYIMYVKDENIAGSGSSTATSRTYWVTATTPWGPYENQGYSTERSVGPSSGQFEGVNNFYIGSDLYIIGDSNVSIDASSDNMKLYKATDSTGKHFTDVTSTSNIPSLTPKHGSITNLTEYDIQDVRDAMKAFVSKVASGTKYNNIADAYAKYVRCQQLVDAYDYGLRTDLDYNTAVNGLNFAMAHMTEWSEKSLPLKSESQDGSLKAANLVYGDEMKNVLYAYGVSGDAPYKNSGGTDRLKNTGMQYGQITFLYDGNTMACPINCVIAYSQAGAGSGIGTKNRIRNCYPTTVDFTLNHYWHGIDRGTGYKTSIDENYTFGHKSYPGLDKAANSWGTGSATYTYYASNTLYYTGSLGSNEYMRTINGVTYHIEDNNDKFKDTTMDANCTNGSAVIRIINYVPLKEKRAAAQGKTYLADITSYKEGGLKDYADSLDRLQSFNLNDYFATVSDNNYDACAAAIKDAVEGYKDTATTDSPAYADLRYNLDHYVNAVKGTCTQEALWNAYQQAIANARAAMANVYTAENYDTIYNGNTIQQIADALKKAYDDVTKLLNHEQIKYNSEDAQFAYFNCVADSSHEAVQTADITVYNLLKLVYGTIDPDKYADNGAAVKAAKTEFDKLPQLTLKTDEITAQKAVDNMITALLNAANSNAKKFKVTFIYNIDGVETISKDAEEYIYDSVVPLTAKSTAQCTGWTVETADSTKAIAYYGSTYDVRIQQDCTITAYFTNNTAQNLVTVYNQYGNVLYQFAADQININGSTITANGKDYKVPDMPYMKVTGFRIGGTQLTDGDMDVTQPIKLYPVHTRTGSTSTVKLDGTVIGTPVYDEIVTLDTNVANAYAIAIKLGENNYSIVAYGTHYEYYANLDKNFVTVTKQGNTYATTDGYTFTDKLTIHKLDNKLPFVYSTAANTDPDNNKYTAFNAYSTQNSDVKILEIGTIFSTTAHTNDTLVIDGEGVTKSISKNQIDFSNQYSLSLKNAIGKNVSTRAYVKYQYTLYDGNMITVIEYSDICNTENL